MARTTELRLRSCRTCGGTGWVQVRLSRLPGLTARRRCRRCRGSGTR